MEGKKMINSLKIINTIAQSFDDNILSIKTELIRVDSQLSFCEVTIDSENNTQLVFITVNKALKKAKIARDSIWDGFHVQVPSYKTAFLLAADINQFLKGGVFSEFGK